MRNAIEVLFDKRFGWRFKLANLIMGDYLRNYLTVGVLLPLLNIAESNYIERYYGDDPYILDIKSDCKRVVDTINELMEA